MTTLFKADAADMWLYAPKAARMLQDESGRYGLSLVRRRKREGSGPIAAGPLVTFGGTLSAELDLAAALPSRAQELAWTAAIRRDTSFVPEGEAFGFVAMGPREGTITVGGLGALVDDPAAYRNVQTSTSPSFLLTLDLNENGADKLWQCLDGGQNGLPICVRHDYTFNALSANCHYRVNADRRATYDYFSANVEISASYYGSVGGQAVLQRVREKLLRSGAVRISWERSPVDFDTSRLREAEWAIIDLWVKSALDQMVDEVLPESGDFNPEGYFGVVSVIFKEFTAIGNLDLDANHDGSMSVEQRATFCYNFKQMGDVEVDTYGIDIVEEGPYSTIL
jgi:hypothetical protein